MLELFETLRRRELATLKNGFRFPDAGSQFRQSVRGTQDWCVKYAHPQRDETCWYCCVCHLVIRVGVFCVRKGVSTCLCNYLQKCIMVIQRQSS